MSLRFEKRDSVFEDLEDVYEGELFLGSIAPAKHGRPKHDYWHSFPVGERASVVTGREAALKTLQKARAPK